MIFVANKPAGISSNRFLSQIKKNLKIKKAGYSGTLDPFASGALIIATQNDTRFFRFLNKEPKIYRLTMWLGAQSKSLDNENIENIEILKPFNMQSLNLILENLRGEIAFIPPKFSAKKVDGERAYNLAREGKDFTLKECKMKIFNSKILNYMHPFLSIEISISEGGYARSYAEIFAKKLGVKATLSSLHRVSEGEFKFQNYKPIDIKNSLSLDENFYNGNFNDINLGKKLDIKNFSKKDDGVYLVNSGDFYAILEFKDENIKYLLNRIEF